MGEPSEDISEPVPGPSGIDSSRESESHRIGSSPGSGTFRTHFLFHAYRYILYFDCLNAALECIILHA